MNLRRTRRSSLFIPMRNKNSKLRVLAIDPGFARIGLAILEKNDGKEKLLFSCCLSTDKSVPKAVRLASIASFIKEKIKEFKPGALAIEDLFFSKNQKTALGVAEARGVILSEAAKNNLEIFEYKPREVKIAVTGYGASDKKQVTEMVKRILEIGNEKKLDDEYDAIAVGLTHLSIIR